MEVKGKKEKGKGGKTGAVIASVAKQSHIGEMSRQRTRMNSDARAKVKPLKRLLDAYQGHLTKALALANSFIKRGAPEFILVLLCGCSAKMPLPPSPQSVPFGSGDTTYIHLAPDWTSNNGVSLSQPGDIVVGPDGQAFVADQGHGRIVAYDRSGASVAGAGLDRLTGFDSLEAIGQDEKLNLYIVTGGSTVWYWNQYVNQAGVQAVLDYFVVYDTLTTDTLNLTFGEFDSLNASAPGRYDPFDLVLSDDPARSDSALGPSIFYQEPSGHARYRGVSGGPDETVYVCDMYFDQVTRLTLKYRNLVQLCDGSFGYTYYGVYDRPVATYGTGMGTTIDPAGVFIQVQGGQHYIYFAQTGGNFLVQKIREQAVGDFFEAFGPNDDIMQLGRFAAPRDVWVAEQYLGNNWIFVADTDSNRIQVFDPSGDFLMYAGERDSSGVLIFDELDHPQGVAHFEGILYVADTGNNRIARYALSTDVENIPGE